MHVITNGGHISANLLISEANFFISRLAVPLTLKTINGPIRFRYI